MPSSETARRPGAVLGKGKRFLFQAVLGGIALLLAGLAGEIVVRILETRASRQAFRYRPVTRPGTRASDDAGSDGPESMRLGTPPRGGRPGASLSESPTPTITFRVLGIGDSFTYGAGVHRDATYLAQLERRLAPTMAPATLVVWNTATPGLSTFDELKLYNRKLHSWNADAVVLGFCLNDAEDKRLRIELNERRGPFFPRPLTPRQQGIAKFWHTYAFVHGRLEATRTRREYRRYVEELFQPGYSGWQACAAALAEFGAVQKRTGTPILVVIWPFFTNPLDQGYPYREIHARVAAECVRNGLEVLDLLPEFESMDGRCLQVVPDQDGHPNEVAHRIAADAIAGRVGARWRAALAARKM